MVAMDIQAMITENNRDTTAMTIRMARE